MLNNNYGIGIESKSILLLEIIQNNEIHRGNERWEIPCSEVESSEENFMNQ